MRPNGYAPASAVKHVGNTEFESHLSDQGHLDKTPVSPEATDLASHIDRRRYGMTRGR